MKFKWLPTLKNSAVLILLVSIIIQVIIALNFKGEQVSDQAAYLSLAKESAANKSFYPSGFNVYDTYLWAPGYINFLSLALILFGNIKAAFLLNIALLFLINLEIFFLAKKFFSEKTAWLSILISCFYATHYGIILFTATELLFTSLIFGSIFFYSKDKLYYVASAGVLLGLANWVRPFLPVFLMVIILMTLLYNGKRVLKISLFIFSLAFTIITIGFITYKSCGYFAFQSSTSGVNIILAANDDADGAYNNLVFQEGKSGYIDKAKRDSMTFKEKDAYWRNAGINWIKQNPKKYISLFPRKLFLLYGFDLSFIEPLDVEITTDEHTGTKAKIMNTIKSFPRLNYFQWLMIYTQLFYLLMLLLAIFGFYLVIKRRNKMGVILGICWVLGTCLIMLFLGASRYHYPYIPIIIIFSAYAVSVIGFKGGKFFLSPE